MFSYYGSKSKLVRHYSAPKYDTIIEPFAGSAQYAFHYWDKNIILIEKDKALFEIWNWLINEASYTDVINLPLFKAGEVINIENQIIRNLIALESFRGSCIRSEGDFNNRTLSDRNRWSGRSGNGCGRERIAESLCKIKHWKIICGDYSSAPDIQATWFVDPPYNNPAGERYNYNCKQIDYSHLGDWCRNRKGQTIVCEELLADWLPFEFLCGNSGQDSTVGKNIEAFWENENI